ncbi:PepSY domain-containing protein [Rhodoferax saidenbachensis]|uniref:PepSY domain-containing protein n=1 Tax=Rhodoferax saidenbachensis TaxID=1484693 RepID=A0A1P8KE00_9BURK|nr:hypothetical protein RS694_18160 [Rhodoferax saidenbachensis]
MKSAPGVRSIAVFVIGLVALSSVAATSPTCSIPKDRWMDETSLKRELLRQGYLIKTIRVRNECYEIYGLDPFGRRVQILIDPATSQPVEDP